MSEAIAVLGAGSWGRVPSPSSTKTCSPVITSYSIHYTKLYEGDKGISVDKFVADMNAGKTSYGVVDTAKLFSIMDFYRDNMGPNAVEDDFV